MPAEARPRARRLPSGKWQLRYTVDGEVSSGGAFASKTEALNHYRDVIEPDLHGTPAARRDVTLSELVDTFLDRHETVAKPRTIKTLRCRMQRPLDVFGDTPLVELERMTDEIAGFAAQLPDRYRYSVMNAFRQTGVEPGCGGVGDRKAREDVRPPLDLCLERARLRDHRVRARADHGNERRDDRGPLRRSPRHRSRVPSRAPGRRFGHESGMRPRAESPSMAKLGA